VAVAVQVVKAAELNREQIMHCTYHDIGFNLEHFLTEEMPWTQAFWRQEPEAGQLIGPLYPVVEDYFRYTTENSHNMPVYNLNISACREIELTFEKTYAMLVDAVGRLLNLTHDQIMEYMGREFLEKHPYFIDYARFTYRDLGSARQSIYGRFDAAFDPVTDKITGIYEFNGDTPTMLLESVAMQDHVCRELTGESELQLNSYYPLARSLFDQLGHIPGKGAVVYDERSFEVMATSETVAQIMGEYNDIAFISTQAISYDFVANPTNPWHYGDQPLSVIFALMPWEELVEACPIAYQQWEKWCHHTTIMEPAWRWFASNKGIWAYVTHLLENNRDFQMKHSGLPVLPTYMTPERFVGRHAYVKKPVIGRMSHNIEIFNAYDPTAIQKTEGDYGQGAVVYQQYCPPHKVEGRGNFILGMFMCPDMATDYHTLKESTAGTMCIREFDGSILSVINERWIPHVLIEDVANYDLDEDEFL
jgi:glutathionylspermidine synthase